MLDIARGRFSLKSVLSRQTALPNLSPGTLTPSDMATLYGLRALYAQGVHGEGERIAFVEFAPPNAGDDAAFWTSESLAPGLNTAVRSVVIDGADPDPTALGETDLDLQYAGALAPGAALTAYVISDSGSTALLMGQMYDAIHQAAADGAHIVSISLGTSDDLFAQASGIRSSRTGQTWSDPVRFAQALDTLIASRGLAVFASAGDSGAYGGLSFQDVRPQPIWPAIQSGIVAVGGTQLALPGDVTSGERAWGGQLMDPQQPGYDHANTLPQASGGGGVSRVLARPAYQAGLSYAGRATPDVAAFAGPLRILYHGRPLAIWGTSASAPITAAVCALIHQASGRLPGHADLYRKAHDVTRGNNWNNELLSLGLNSFYSAAPGYDLCTGMGTPLASGLLAP